MRCPGLLVWDGKEQGLVKAFLNSNSLSLPVFLALADGILYEKPYNIMFQIYFLAYSSLFSINFVVLKLDTAKKVYSANKGLFLGVF